MYAKKLININLAGVEPPALDKTYTVCECLDLQTDKKVFHSPFPFLGVVSWGLQFILLCFYKTKH